LRAEAPSSRLRARASAPVLAASRQPAGPALGTPIASGRTARFPCRTDPQRGRRGLQRVGSRRMEPQAAEYQERLMEEVRTLDMRQMRRVLDFVEELKSAPTEETLLDVLGRPGVSYDDIEDVCEKLRQNGLVTPRLLRSLRALAATKAPPAAEKRVSELMQKSRKATSTEAEREESHRLVMSGERMNVAKAGALVALKLLTGDLPTWARGERPRSSH